MEGKKYNNIIAVDENDNVIAAMPMFEAIEKGYNRRVSRAYVFNESGKVLIQRRSKNVFTPLLLDLSMGGHVDEGETYEEAAKRELMEELGVDAHEHRLKEVTEPFLFPGYFSAMYKVIVPDQYKFKLDPEEVAEVIWFTPDEIDHLISVRSKECTLGLIDSWTKLRDKLVT